MHMPYWRAMMLLGAALCVVRTAHADALRCGQQLVSSGDTAYEVQSTCGNPDDRQQHSEWRTARHVVRVPCRNGTTGICTQVIERTVEVQVERWTYDFGKQRLLRYLTFEQGTLIRVESGGYGGKR